jgi:hypothetical protein
MSGAKHTEMVRVPELSFTIDVDALVIVPTLTLNLSFAACHLDAGLYGSIYTASAGGRE